MVGRARCLWLDCTNRMPVIQGAEAEFNLESMDSTVGSQQEMMRGWEELYCLCGKNGLPYSLACLRSVAAAMEACLLSFFHSFPFGQ